MIPITDAKTYQSRLIIFILTSPYLNTSTVAAESKVSIASEKVDEGFLVVVDDIGMIVQICSIRLGSGGGRMILTEKHAQMGFF